MLTLGDLKHLLVDKPGLAPKVNQIVSHSWYFYPLEKPRTRRWGDASPDQQVEAVNSILTALHDFDKETIAFALSLCRCESGFSVEAAAPQSSAAGLFQFVNATRRLLYARHCRLTNERSEIRYLDNPFRLDLDLKLIRHQLNECLDFAKRRAKKNSEKFFEYGYAYHHDGPSLQYGGSKIAREKVLPLIPEFLKLIQS